MKTLAVVAIAAVIVAGCGSELSSGSSGASTTQLEQAATSDDASRFDFTAPELDTGTAIDGAELYEMSPLIISFVVPSCGVCVEEGPELAAAAEANPDITYVFIHSNADTAAYQDYVSNAGIAAENAIHLQDNEAALWDRFGVSEQPSTAIVDTNGVVTVSRGALGAEGLVAAAEKALNNT